MSTSIKDILKQDDKVLKFRDMKLYSRQMERESTYSNNDTRQKRNQGEKSSKGKKKYLHCQKE